MKTLDNEYQMQTLDRLHATCISLLDIVCERRSDVTVYVANQDRLSILDKANNIIQSMKYLAQTMETK